MGCGRSKEVATSPVAASEAPPCAGSAVASDADASNLPPSLLLQPEIDEPLGGLADIKLRKALFVTDFTGKVEDSYYLDRQLGQGRYAAVHKACSKLTGKAHAIKTIVKSQKENVERGIKMIKQEIDIMSKVCHHNVIELHETIEDRWNVYLVMELCGGQNLYSYINERTRLKEPEAIVVMRDMLNALHYLHENRICHRDVKPENLVLLYEEDISADNAAKLVDFGFACEFVGDQAMHERLGSPLYVAPQVLMGYYDHKCDLWSCGVVLFVMLCGYLPFYAETDEEQERLVCEGSFTLKDSRWDSVSLAAKNMVCSLLRFDPPKRLSAEQALAHELMAEPPTLAIDAAEEVTVVCGWCPACAMSSRSASKELQPVRLG